MSISEVLLFIATNSRACMGCMEFIDRHRLPVKIIRLDSEEARTIAAGGTFFQITVVPTMVVIYNDGNTQLFIGTPKIIQWLTMMISRQESPERGVTSYTPAGGNMYGPRPNPPRPNIERERVPEEYEGRREEQRSRIIVEDDEPSEEEERPVKKSKKVPPKKKITKKKKTPPVQFDEPDQEVEVEYIEDEPPAPVKTKPEKKGKKPQSRMSNIYATAQQMEQERKNSLGYKEEDLPRY